MISHNVLLVEGAAPSSLWLKSVWRHTHAGGICATSKVMERKFFHAIAVRAQGFVQKLCEKRLFSDTTLA